MSNKDDVIVMLATFGRTEYALRTIRAIMTYMKYDGLIRYYLADAGSSQEHHIACIEEISKMGKLWDGHNIYQSPGDNWNMAFDKIFQETDFAFRLEDDFELRRELNVTPYVKALKEKEDWGIIRLGHLPVGLDCHTVGHNGIHYLQMKRSTQYGYSGNPLIMHKRYWELYGKYTPGLSPGMTEIAYDDKYRKKEGLEIFWPVDLGGWGIFGHIGEVKSI